MFVPAFIKVRMNGMIISIVTMRDSSFGNP